MTNKLNKWAEEDLLHSQMFQQVFGRQRAKTSPLLSTTFRYRTKSIATIAMFMNSQGEKPNNISQVLRYALEMFEDLVVKDFPNFAVSGETQAKVVLDGFGISSAVTKTNKHRQVNNMSLESFLQEKTNSSSLMAEAEHRFNESIKPQTHDYPQSQEGLTTELSPGPSPGQEVKKGKLILKRNGITRLVAKDSAKTPRREVFIICLVCHKPSRVLLDFEPSSEIVNSDSCPNCEGITEHGITDDPSKGVELSAFDIPLSKFREQMLPKIKE